MSGSHPAEDALLAEIRKELEPRGFRYRARKLWKVSKEWRVHVEIERYRWTPPGKEMFDVAAEFEVFEPVEAIRIHLTKCIGRRTFFGSKPNTTKPGKIDLAEIADAFRRYIVPIVTENESPEQFAERLANCELAPGVAHYENTLGRIRDAYTWGVAAGRTDIQEMAVHKLRDLGQDPQYHDQAAFMWQALEIPGSFDL